MTLTNLSDMSESIKKIPLEQIHIDLGGKMVDFAGYNMPVKYSSVVEEHKTVRTGAGIFDVSHMGEFLLEGPMALSLIQTISSNDASILKVGEAQYTCMPNGKGGIVDDMLVYKLKEDKYMLVVNASNIDKDWNWIKGNNIFGVKMENISDGHSLFAVQGPKATAALQELTDINLADIEYYTFRKGKMADVDDLIISATGYTGAGGYEIYVPNRSAEKLWNAIMKAGEPQGILPIGLGARDTLRLEMGFCLYGNDIDDTTSPIEAGLGWITKFTKFFIDSQVFQKQKEDGLSRKLVGFQMVEKGIPRSGYDIVNADGNVIGKVTSGGQSPMLDIGIGMGYVEKKYIKKGTSLLIQIRKNQLPATVVKMPFYKA